MNGFFRVVISGMVFVFLWNGVYGLEYTLNISVVRGDFVKIEDVSIIYGDYYKKYDYGRGDYVLRYKGDRDYFFGFGNKNKVNVYIKYSEGKVIEVYYKGVLEDSVDLGNYVCTHNGVCEFYCNKGYGDEDCVEKGLDLEKYLGKGFCGDGNCDFEAGENSLTCKADCFSKNKYVEKRDFSNKSNGEDKGYVGSFSFVYFIIIVVIVVSLLVVMIWRNSKRGEGSL